MYRDRPNPEMEILILLDIPRTFPDHPRFGANGTDTQMLHNVLRAYANFNPAIGYTQGLSFLAAVLLMHTNEEVRGSHERRFEIDLNTDLSIHKDSTIQYLL